uniref:Gastrin-releasing peptide n=1 Tax=Neogobius melanostomus TaxID=47308 RepID=A0A8C6TB92_9GOBI
VPYLPLVVILATISCLLHSTESSVPAGKLYPRGNHWAVGHLMGKKSISSYASLQHRHEDEYLRGARTTQAMALERRGLLQHQTSKQKRAPTVTARKGALIRGRWRRVGIYRFLLEVA